MAYQPTTNFGWAMPRGGDQAQISVINQQFTAKADEIVYQTRRMIAPGYIDDGSKTYQPGEIVEYENVDYVCTGTTSGAWDSSKWDSTDMATQIQEAKESGGTNVEANPVEAATADLHKLKVDTTVYGIPDPTVTKTLSGNPIEISDGASAPLVKCVTQIQGSQDLHGYDKPWVGGAGKNKLDISDVASATTNNITYKCENGVITLSGTANANTTLVFPLGSSVDLSPSTNKIAFNNSVSNALIECRFVRVNAIHYWALTPANRIATTWTDTGNENVSSVELYIPNGVETNLTIGIVLMDKNGSDTSFAPYSNICPITAYTEGEIEVSDGDGNTTHTTTYPYAIYRGSEDVVNGEVSVDNDEEMWVTVDISTLDFSPSTGSRHIFRSDSLRGIIKPSATTSSMPYAITSCYCGMGHGPIGENDNGYFAVAQVSHGYEGRLVIIDHRFSTVDDFVAGIAGQTIAYRLNTPTTSSVTPTNLPIKSLSGYSHIESTTGEMEVEYITQTYQPLVDLIDEAAEAKLDTYSTTEHKIGTWIDGSKLYKKTFTFTISQSGETITVADVSYIDQLVEMSGVLGNATMLPQVSRGAATAQTWATISSGNLIVFVGTSGDEKMGASHITLKYTKTSSNNRSLSALSKGPSEESVDKVDKVDKVDEPTETIQEKEENAGESNSENER